MTIMHHQYLATRDIKFPDQKQYTKPGDLILFNDANASLTIYRNEALIGTVHFSKAGLLEFIRLGWIVRPTEVNATAPAPKAKRVAGVDLGLGKDKSAAVIVEVSPDGANLTVLGDVEIHADSIVVDEHTVPATGPNDDTGTSGAVGPKPRKPKKS